MDSYVIGVDVGTGSARAALVSSRGQVCKISVQPIETWKPRPEYFEQSSENIWDAVCRATQEVAKCVSVEKIKSIGFDATCSLVVLDRNCSPCTVSPTGEDKQNIILWMDHRAKEMAAFINKLDIDVLQYVGGVISPEMQTPKLMWLKKNLPETWKKAYHFMDLPDFLTWRATGSYTRSLCSLVCKWTYRAGGLHEEGWNSEFLKAIGLSDLCEDDFRKIGDVVQTPGTPIGNGLTQQAAQELGLLKGICVSTSLIDAHAGGVGLLGCNAQGISDSFETRLALICGTSTCHMLLSEKPTFVKGVWGPYWNAMVPDMWLNEGGQTCTGHLLDHIINTHPATPAIRNKLQGVHIQQYLNNLLESMAKKQGLSNLVYLTKDLHMWPDFHGNRSPLANPKLLGMISGLTLAVDEESLALLYLATVQSLAYGTRHILNACINSGNLSVKSVLLCGGLSRNALFVQVHADVLGMPVLCAQEPESVLLGSAMMAAYAAKMYASVYDAMHSMGGTASVVLPDTNLFNSRFHDKKYAVFLSMLEDQLKYKNLMESND